MQKKRMMVEELVRTAGRVGDLLIPRECAVCGRRLLEGERHLCIFCEADLPLTYFWNWHTNPMSDRLNALIQRDMVKELEDGVPLPERMGRARAAALFYYMSEAGYKRIPQKVKYWGDRPAGRFYGRMLGRFIALSGHFGDIDTVVPVPLHWTRKWKRGYNQAEVIAAGIAAEIGAELRTDILLRARRTGTQTKLHDSEKVRNVSGAFRIRERYLHEERPKYGRERHFLIVDDVFTTGATIASCCASLFGQFGNSISVSAATLGFVDRG